MATNELNIPGRVPNSDNMVFSSFYGDNHVDQNTFIIHPKTVLIDLLRREFSKDSLYTYRADEYGFPLVVEMTNEIIDTENSTRILISDQFRQDMKFFPNIKASSKGGSSKNLSATRNGTISYRSDVYEDEYGDRREIIVPSGKVYAGLWEHSLDLKINTRSHTEVEELGEIVALMINHTLFHELRASGIIVNQISVSSASSEKDGNTYIHSMVIGLSCTSEWRVEIPIDGIIEKIALNITTTLTPSNFSSTINHKFSDIVQIAEFESVVDTDGDGLSDVSEVDVYGTDPLNADTDNDGINDGFEVNTLGTDPLSADTFNQSEMEADLSSQVDGITRTFEVPYPFYNRYIVIYYNGVRQLRSDATIISATSFTLSFTPQVSTAIVVVYQPT